jgi:P2 family phage contractile tail tube protein
MPNIEAVTEEYRGGGMDGPVNVDLGISAMTMSFTMREYDPRVLGLFAVGDCSNKSFVFRGAQEDNLCNVVPVVLEVRGWVSGVDHGTWEAGSLTDIEVTVNIRYLNFQVNGIVVYEIDPINMIRIINGRDVLADQRRAVGL